VATREELAALLIRRVVAPKLSAEAGHEIAFQIRRLHFKEYYFCLAPLPAELLEGDLTTLGEREQAWLATLTDEEKQARLLEAARSTWRIVAAGLMEPKLSWEEVAALGDDADVLAHEILTFSRLLATAESNGSASEPAPVENAA
jgi:hypothetical protein